MTGVPRSEPALIDELRAVLAGLGHARAALQRGEPDELNALWVRVDRCAQEIEALEAVDKDRARPVLLALLDELARTIEAFAVERRKLGDKLKSTNRNAVAGAAYRQARTR